MTVKNLHFNCLIQMKDETGSFIEPQRPFVSCCQDLQNSGSKAAVNSIGVIRFLYVNF